MVILCILEVIVLSFAILSGLENGFKLWNWIIIAVGIFVYFLSIMVAIIYDNKDRKTCVFYPKNLKTYGEGQKWILPKKQSKKITCAREKFSPSARTTFFFLTGSGQKGKS